MKICICTTPIRPVPTTFPPFGSMAIIQSLRGIGEDVSFFNIDYFRYKHAEIEKYFKENQFDIVGISAVVSTAYAYTKYLSKLIRAVSPNSVIVLGGNLAASAEIIMRKCEIDFCVAGDGDFVIRELVQNLNESPPNYTRLRATKGIAFIDDNDLFVFTGYGAKPSAEEISWPEYAILEADGSLPYFISEIVDKRLDGHDRPLAEGARLATVNLTKGCVARCTFCHRWEKGFRTRPVDQAIEHIKMLKEKYNVRFLDVCDENFGADSEITNELVARLGELNISWRCAGVRARSVNLQMLKHWKKNGCVTANYGVESGSQTMLNIMEKNTTVEQNINALIWASEAGLNTVVQLVVGMPGENDDTIRETIDFLNKTSGSLRLWSGKAPSDLISVNYAQALPGTPLYEWAREHGYIGKTIDEEEKYLLKISDTDAYSEDHFVNYTGLPMLRVLMWRPWLYAEIDFYNFSDREEKGLSILEIVRYYMGVIQDRLEKRLLKGSAHFSVRFFYWLIGGKLKPVATQAGYDYVTESGYFNISNSIKFAPLLLNPVTKKYFFALLAIAVALRKGGSLGGISRLLTDYLYWSISGGKRRGPTVEPKSLRKVIKINVRNSAIDRSDAMLPLRKGR
jgi:anaerobic magnesium-protoporphyrin IX monomethyl ester cyclase